MKLTSLLALTGSALTLTINAAAEETLACFGFEEAIEIGIEVNPAIEVAKAQKEIADASLLGAISQTRPQVTLFAQAGEGDGRLRNNQRDNQIGLQVQQTLYNFGSNKLGQISARESVRAAEYSISDTKEQAAQDIGTAYHEYLRAQAILALSKEQEAYYLEDALSADDRLKANAITIADASQIKASAALATSERVEATLLRDQAHTRLAILLDAEKSMTCVENKTVELYTTDVQGILKEETLDSLLDYAARNTAAVKQSQSQIRSARAATEQTRREGLPSVSVSAFIAYEEDLNSNPFVRSDDEWVSRDRVGINITSPLYRGGLGKARVDDSLARLRTANSELTSLRARQEEAITRLWVRLQSQEVTLSSLSAARDNYKTQLDNIREEYEIGTKTLAELVIAAERYYSTASEEINARYRYYNNVFVLYASVFGSAN